MASYTQTFSAGASPTSMQQHGWQTIVYPPGNDPLYPYAVYISEADVIGSQLVLWSGVVRPDAWDELIFAEDPFGSIDGSIGKFEVVFDISTVALADTTARQFIVMHPNVIPGRPNRTALGMYLIHITGDTWAIMLGYSTRLTPYPQIQLDSYQFDKSTLYGTELTLTLCWNVYTGMIQVRKNGTLIYDVIVPFSMSATTTAAEGLLSGYFLLGTPGPVSRVTLENTNCLDLPPADDGGDPTIPCCEDGGPTGGGDVGTNPDPVGTLPPWEASCTGGGLVDGVSDLSDGESWL